MDPKKIEQLAATFNDAAQALQAAQSNLTARQGDLDSAKQNLQQCQQTYDAALKALQDAVQQQKQGQ